MTIGLSYVNNSISVFKFGLIKSVMTLNCLLIGIRTVTCVRQVGICTMSSYYLCTVTQIALFCIKHTRRFLQFQMCIRECSDQPIYPHSLYRIFTCHIRKLHDILLCNERPAKTDQPALMLEISCFTFDPGHNISYVYAQ